MVKTNIIGFFTTMTLIAFFIYAGAKVMSINDNQIDIKNQIISQVGENEYNLLWAGVFVKTLDHLTPTVKLYKIPFINKDYFLINKFPLVGWMHLLVITFILLLLRVLTKFVKIKIGWILLIGLVLIIMAYFIGSYLDHYLYQLSAEKLNISKADALLFADNFSNELDNVLLPMLLFTSISLVAGIKILFKVIKTRRK